MERAPPARACVSRPVEGGASLPGETMPISSSPWPCRRSAPPTSCWHLLG